MGMMDCLRCSHHHCQPEASMSALKTKGSQPRWMENSRMNSRPVKKVGSEKPTKAIVLAMRSNQE